MTIQQAFDVAIKLHQANRLTEAEQIYRQILAREPNHPEALNLLGVIACQAGRNDAGADLIRQAIAVQPDWAEAYNNLGNALKAAGKLDEGVTAFRRAIELRPDYPEALCNLGNAVKDKGQLDAAIELFRRAVALRPAFPEAHFNLGNALGEKPLPDEAIAAYRQAIALRPSYADAIYNLGNILKIASRPDEAAIAYRQAISLRPTFAEAYNNLGNVLKSQAQLDLAMPAYRQAIALKPDYAEAYSNMSIALSEQGQIDNALAACKQAMALRPDMAEAYGNMGLILQYKGALPESVAAHRKAIALAPSVAEYHNNLALTLLLAGDYESGWPEYEWRSRCKDFPSARRNFPQRQWGGQNLPGGAIFLYFEQGFGDTLQFIRFVPMVAQRCRKVIVACQPELRRLLHSTPGATQWISADETLPPFDAHCPLPSLPSAFGATLASIPKHVPYVRADARDIERWRERLSEHEGSLKVGLAWAGNPTFRAERFRSPRLLSLFSPLAEVKNVQFFSLQKGEAAKQTRNPPPGMRLIDYTNELHDFADTAGLIANLDLVISSDTAVAHLAGAMGKPTWTMLAFVPDWRWHMNRPDCPWYPTMRLFRQPGLGDWNGVIRQVMTALRVQADRI